MPVCVVLNPDTQFPIFLVQKSDYVDVFIIGKVFFNIYFAKTYLFKGRRYVYDEIFLQYIKRVYPYSNIYHCQKTSRTFVYEAVARTSRLCCNVVLLAYIVAPFDCV